LKEAIQSAKAAAYKDVEIVIVDDGSTDEATRACLQELESDGIRVIYQENKGPAAARNTGVIHSKGEYLLFLDSDNMIKPEYPSLALKVLEEHPEVGVVYANPVFFGAANEAERFTVEPFNLDRLLIGNHVDMCSVVRRQAWDDVGGFDDQRTLLPGCEDWEFWIRVARKGWRFHLLHQELFYYRVRENSITTTVFGDTQKQIINYVTSKHHDIIFARYKYYARLYRKIQQKPFLFFLKFIYSKYILRKDYLPD